ncbi:MAG: hypothetical protein IKA74_03165 [Clostridia bacterium]|nr:hypothetical protein [Clostridia bacterium]
MVKSKKSPTDSRALLPSFFAKLDVGRLRLRAKNGGFSSKFFSYQGLV